MNGRRGRGKLIALGLVATTVTYWTIFRPWSSHWGATDEEVRQSKPGDDIVVGPATQTTQAIAIDVPPSAVWPWLIQMGPGRAGAYTYDFIENLFGLNMHSADRIVPEWQHMAVGDVFPLGDSGPPLRVEALEPERALVLGFADRSWSWSFLLEPAGANRTRLITRNRAPAGRLRTRLQWELLLPGAFVMMRKMLLGIKERAERLAETGDQGFSPVLAGSGTASNARTSGAAQIA
jgi:hypothetical protein